MLLTLSLFMLWNSMTQRQKLEEMKAEKARVELEDRKKREADLARENAAKALDKADVEPPEKAPATWHTLGSMDSEEGYRLLVTLTSKGAGIERIELVEQPKPGKFLYRSLATRGGYLGYLAPTIEDRGLRIHSVPKGSAAANAKCDDPNIQGGLAANDILDKVDDQPVRSEFELESSLVKRKPGSSVKVTVHRGEATDDMRELQFSVQLSEPPMDVVRMEDDMPREKAPGNLLRPSMLTTLAKVDGIEAIPGNETIPGLEASLNEDWQAKPLEVADGQGVEFTLPLQGYLVGAGSKANLELVKRYRLHKSNRERGQPASPDSAAYHIDVETLVRNLDSESHVVSIRQEGLNGVSLEGWWYSIKLSPDFFNAAGARDVMLARKTGAHELITRRNIQEYARTHADQPESIFFGMDYPLDKRSFRYIGVDQQYFTTAILPHPDSPDSLDDLAQGAARAVADVPKTVPYKDIATNVSFRFDTKSLTVPGSGEITKQYRVYAGPKDTDVLELYGLGSSMYFGWPIFEWVARPLSFILHTFYGIVRNYGIAIIMLTILVRSCMFPLSRRAAIMGQRMQEMNPEMKRINELYKDDMTKRGQEMQLLYKKYNLNPMASCLPVFIQLPIFIGLYRCVSVDIGLRQQALIPGIEWCSNLAGPDMLASWPTWMPEFIAGKGTGWFGPYINLLPIITIALFIIQQKVLMPKATDEQTRMTQQMMMVMTVFMGVLFFKVPAGLCIYFITSSIWSLIERKLVKKFMPPMTALAADGPAGSPPLTPLPPKPPRPKTSTKSPETISDVVDQMKSIWGKRKAAEPVKTPSELAAERKKQRKKR
jgi:YidC/Oxa1 family membrane protein insertase